MNCTCGMSHEEATNIYEPLRFSLEGCLVIGIDIFGIISNSLAGYVLFTKEAKTLFNKTLFVLATIDILFNISDILETIRLVHYDKESCFEMPSYQQTHLYLVPQFLRPIRTYSIIASMYTTVLIAFDRYFAVSKPIMSFVQRSDDNWAKIGKKMAPILIVSLLFSLPQCFEFYTDSRCVLCINDRQYQYLNVSTCDSERSFNVNMEGNATTECPNYNFHEKVDDLNDDGYCYFRSTLVMLHNEIRTNKTYSIVYINIISNVVTYGIPLTLLFVLNLMIYKHLKRRRHVVKQMGKLTLMMILRNILVLCFAYNFHMKYSL